MNRKDIIIILLSVLITLTTGCRKEDKYIPSTDTDVTDPTSSGDYAGFFLLNEGNMGNNKATLDYFDYATGKYSRNIYAERNPSVALELGDVGNDLKIRGGKIYAVINCSNFIEVMNLDDAVHITEIAIPNCRYITFDGGYAYVTSYAGPIAPDPSYRKGYVAKIDTLTLSVTDTCTVGYQPEEAVVASGKLYVANSGGYMAPEYDNRVSVIDLESFKVVKSVEVADNLHRMVYDGKRYIYISSRGDYKGSESSTYILDTHTDQVSEIPYLPNSNMILAGDSLWIISNEWSNLTQTDEISYAIYDTRLCRVVTRHFITDGTEEDITVPFGIAVNREQKEFYITDAKDYVTPGKLHCYSIDGKRKWSVTTGDIPAHFAFTHKQLISKDK